MEQVTISQKRKDNSITNSDIPLSNRFHNHEEVMSHLEDLSDGDYISLPSRSNLSERAIYRKNHAIKHFENSTKDIDIEWYDDNKEEFLIGTSAELRGIHELVLNGYDFFKKKIYLKNDIDLSNEKWIPIGSPEFQMEETRYIPKGVFRGSFDGKNHTIYGLHNDTDIPYFCFGLFMSVEYAKISNIKFESVNLKSDNVDMCACAVSVFSKQTVFKNIYVDGRIQGKDVASITVFAKNSAFLLCKNNANLICEAYEKTVCVGGICATYEISESLIKRKDLKKATMFYKCINYGNIDIYGNITSLYAGNLFGNCLSEKGDFTVVIDNCYITSNKIHMHGKTEQIDDVYCGEDENGVSIHYDDSSKKDLLFGLLGRVFKTSLEVVKVSDSKKFKGSIIPGSCNTLKSESTNSTFNTVDVDKIKDRDKHYDLSPYFTFIKSIPY